MGLLELKAKLVSAGLLMYWIALNSCTRRKRKKEGRKRERERKRVREREKERKREEADELGLMELKAKPIPLWPSTLARTPKKARKDMV